jgi:hypothetical protein
VRRERHSARRSLSGSPRQQLRAGRDGDYELRSCGRRACPEELTGRSCASARPELEYPTHSVFTGSPAPAWRMGCGRAQCGCAEWYRNRIVRSADAASLGREPPPGPAADARDGTVRRRAGENRHEIPASHPQPLDPTLSMDYGSIELLPKGWTNGDFPPDPVVCFRVGKVGFGANLSRSPVTVVAAGQRRFRPFG